MGFRHGQGNPSAPAAAAEGAAEAAPLPGPGCPHRGGGSTNSSGDGARQRVGAGFPPPPHPPHPHPPALSITKAASCLREPAPSEGGGSPAAPGAGAGESPRPGAGRALPARRCQRGSPAPPPPSLLHPSLAAFLPYILLLPVPSPSVPAPPRGASRGEPAPLRPAGPRAARPRRWQLCPRGCAWGAGTHTHGHGHGHGRDTRTAPGRPGTGGGDALPEGTREHPPAAAGGTCPRRTVPGTAGGSRSRRGFQRRETPSSAAANSRRGAAPQRSAPPRPRRDPARLRAAWSTPKPTRSFLFNFCCCLGWVGLGGFFRGRGGLFFVSFFFVFLSLFWSFLFSFFCPFFLFGLFFFFLSYHCRNKLKAWALVLKGGDKVLLHTAAGKAKWSGRRDPQSQSLFHVVMAKRVQRWSPWPPKRDPGSGQPEMSSEDRAR